MVRAASRGALFVVQGDLEVLHADAYVLSTDANGKVEPYWSWLVGGAAGGPVRQLFDLRADLASRNRAWVPDAGRGAVLAVNMGGRLAANDVEAACGRFADALEALEERFPAVEPQDRQRPLVAMPLLGVGRAGLGGRTGDLITGLLETMSTHFSRRPVGSAGFDIALVCRTASDYAAVQHARRGPAGGLRVDPLPDWLVALADQARAGHLAVMFGAGVSARQGLPRWSELLRALAEALPNSPLAVEDLVALDPTDAATLLIEAGGRPWFEDHLRRILGRDTHSLAHGLIANLRPRLAITTNYDRGYEVASFALTGRAAVVLPWDRPHAHDDTCVLKLHGDLDRGQIVLSRDSFVAMRAFRRPLAGILQERMLIGHVLTVGTSMSDATLVYAAEEVRELIRQACDADPDRMVARGKFGTVILTERNPGRALLLERAFDVIVAGDGAGTSPSEAARQVDVLLDWLAMDASRDLSFALDVRYTGLLDDADRDVVDALQSFTTAYLHVRAAEPSGHVQSAADAFLRSLGANLDEEPHP